MAFFDWRSSITSKVSTEQAFSLIGDAVLLTLSQTDDYLCYECLNLILDLARQSDTTQVHPVLYNNWDLIIDHYFSLNSNSWPVDQLKHWYRRY